MWVFSAVLDLEFPTNIRALLNALKPFMIDLQSILQVRHCVIQQENCQPLPTPNVLSYTCCAAGLPEQGAAGLLHDMDGARAGYSAGPAVGRGSAVLL